MSPEWSAEIPKAVASLIVAVVTLASGWLIGQRLTFYWSVRQKQREFLLSATTQFHAAYGEFFAIWKLFNRLDPSDAKYEERRWDLLQRSAKAEASNESILLKIVTEFPLTAEEAGDLGRFRQGFQRLRQTIRDRTPLDWPTSEDPQYAAFKRLSCSVALLLQRSHSQQPTLEQAVRNHRIATSNQWEVNWWN